MCVKIIRAVAAKTPLQQQAGAFAGEMSSTPPSERGGSGVEENKAPEAPLPAL